MKSIKGRRILLIGGAGFIGHHLALELKRLDAEVSIIDGLQINNFLHFSSTESDIENREMYLEMLNQRLLLLRQAEVPIFIQDVRDYHALNILLRDIQPDVIFHLAAVSHAGLSNKTPYTTFDHSFRTLENALDASRDRVDHFIYFSSSMIYGNFTEGYVTEQTPCEPIGIYGALKFGGEKLVIAYNQVFNLPYTIIRPSALYGERCVSRRVGQIFIENALKGSDISVRGDGSDKLDFTYIDDLVKGLVNVLCKEEAKNNIFNLTYGESRSLNELLLVLKDFFPNICVNYLAKDKLIPDRGTLSIYKAKKALNYQPGYPLEKGFIKYIEWYKNFYSYYQKKTDLNKNNIT